MRQPDAAVLQRVEALRQRYVDALDRRDMADWLDCFARQDAASYLCISAENMERGLEVALMLDDCRARLQDRVTFVTKVWAGTFQPYRTRHFTQLISCEAQPAGTVRVRSNFSIAITPDGGVSDVLAVGEYDDQIVLEGDEPRFLSKRAIYDTTVLPRYIVYPF